MKRERQGGVSALEHDRSTGTIALWLRASSSVPSATLTIP